MLTVYLLVSMVTVPARVHGCPLLQDLAQNQNFYCTKDTAILKWNYKDVKIQDDKTHSEQTVQSRQVCVINLLRTVTSRNTGFHADLPPLLIYDTEVFGLHKRIYGNMAYPTSSILISRLVYRRSVLARLSLVGFESQPEGLTYCSKVWVKIFGLCPFQGQPLLAQALHVIIVTLRLGSRMQLYVSEVY
ncbi:hypothetical protein ARMGADRAFT_1113402 [Armillaria gallica]|uniref:Uncharacterized protein n=1 Tax=Armillaria gallica TaxID=47427 RepID=A0A2H3DKE8_ARMGA|nr:hypothetical protein ARMGADRAFT_1113402 [Armillaria gallica]